MSKIIYYIGAGASYGRKEAREVLDEGTGSERLIIHEGLPVVSEITKSLLTFKKAVEEVKIEEQNSYLFMDGMDMYKSHGSNIINWQIELIRDIDELYKASMEHATIDTYAKKLILTRMENKFKRLKHVLSAFFVWVQLEGKVDTRYDTFLANILQINDLNFPQEISIISWNYDSQFELAYKNFNPEGSLPIYEKTVDGNFPPLNNYGRIFKVNGSANFSDFNIVNFINKHDVKPIIQLIEYYGNLYADTSELGFQLHSHLSFAWETSEKRDQLMEAIKQTTKDTESIVVIGYSFPFFNREIDRKIFVGMPNLKTIYIQDPYPDAVEQSLKAVLPEGSKVKIEHQKDCTQFYLPREL